MTAKDLGGQAAVVTGGARGIGLAVAERLLKAGAAVALWDVDVAQLAQAKARLDAFGHVVADEVELTDAAAVEAASARAESALGRVDILINNAGITGGNGNLWELSPEIFRRVLEVNLVGPFLTCRALAPRMAARGYGRIVNIASIAGKEGNPGASHYSASKAGLIGLTKSLAKELATKGVLVNAVTPAAAKTAIFDQMTQEHIDYMLAKIPMRRFLQVEEAAAMITWLSSAECSFSTGAVFDLSGGRATY